MFSLTRREMEEKLSVRGIDSFAQCSSRYDWEHLRLPETPFSTCIHREMGGTEPNIIKSSIGLSISLSRN